MHMARAGGVAQRVRALGSCIAGMARNLHGLRGVVRAQSQQGAWRGAVHRADIADFEERVRRRVGCTTGETREANELSA